MSAMYTSSRFKQINTEMAGASFHVAKSNLNRVFDLEPTELTLYHFYDPENPLHEEYNKDISNYFISQANKASVDVRSIDLSEIITKSDI